MSASSSTSTPILTAVLSAVAILSISKYIAEDSGITKTREIESTRKKLGPWLSYAKKPTYPWNQPKSLLGPQISARLAEKFCGINEVFLSRVPHGEMGTACWTILLSTIHPQALPSSINSSEPLQDRAEMSRNHPHNWSQIQCGTLVNHDSELCVKISRATLMTLFALTNARPIYRYSSAAGHRSAYPSYCGQWTISWPIGKPCVVRLAPHDSHLTTTDVYPPSFPARIDKCVEMMAGIISDGIAWKMAFPGRAKSPGPWLLQERPKGFGAAHGARHLYNMQGGKVFEVDLFALVRTLDDHVNAVKLELPCLGEAPGYAIVYVPKHEAQILAKSLDCLPWSSLSWSLHRGLKDVLLAYGKPVMDEYRERLAAGVQAAVAPNRTALIKKGWAPELVDGPMGTMAASAILSGGGNSGDMVRIVVAIVECLIQNFEAAASEINLDNTTFWHRQSQVSSAKLFAGRDLGAADMAILVPLTKFFVLEWSQELDYQLYHDLPVEILLA